METASGRNGATDLAGGLETLRDASLQPADPSLDLRGRTVRTLGGTPLGEVDDLLIDVGSRSVRFLSVGRGGVLGLGRRRRFIPVEAIVRMDIDDVHVEATGRDPRWRPRYAPTLVEDEGVFASLDRDGPYWVWGFAYPFGMGVLSLSADRAAGAQHPKRGSGALSTETEPPSMPESDSGS